MRRETVERLGGFEAGFQGIYQFYEDQAFFAKLYLNASVFVASQCWDKYRLHPDSCGSVVKKAGKYHTVRLFFLNWLKKYLSAQNVKDAEVWDALEKAIWVYRYPILSKITGLIQRFEVQVKGLVKSVAR